MAGTAFFNYSVNKLSLNTDSSLLIYLMEFMAVVIVVSDRNQSYYGPTWYYTLMEVDSSRAILSTQIDSRHLQEAREVIL